MQLIAQTRNTFKRAADTVGSAATTIGGVVRGGAYAGLGLVAVAEEEITQMYKSLVTEGRQVESGRAKSVAASAVDDARREVREARVQVQQAVVDAERDAAQVALELEHRSEALEQRVSAMVVDVLKRLNVPTRQDVEALKRSVDRLDRKAAELRAA